VRISLSQEDIEERTKGDQLRPRRAEDLEKRERERHAIFRIWGEKGMRATQVEKKSGDSRGRGKGDNGREFD